MEEDDMDFTPSPNTNSNLASLFGLNKKPLKGNPSLTYTAPKPPKRESSPAKKDSTEPKTNKRQILCSKAVKAYKLENRNYVCQGVNGIVISGDHSSHTYEIIIYKPTKEHISQTKISRTFTITISLNNYVSFYDNSTQNWSIMFQSSADLEEFVQKLAICKFYSHPEPFSAVFNLDLTPMSHPQVNQSGTIDVVYSVHSCSPEEVSKIKDEVKERIKLPEYSFTLLSNNLIGCYENCKRLLIIPNSLSGPWKSDLSSNKDLLLVVRVEKIVTEQENLNFVEKPQDDGPESPIDSSAEEASIKARGVSIKEALISKKSQKASLISRMAKMGQATLPLRQGLSGGPSDSEEEAVQVSSPKPRMPRSRMNNQSLAQTSQTPEGAQQLSVYHNDSTWQQSPKIGVQYQQLIPVSASPISSPTTDPSLSVYVSESRIQATELRMGISKISEKLDLVWNKVQNLSAAGGESKPHQPPTMDPGGILSSIQSLITENENLKEKVEEQKGKIEQQNDRIFHLLELNHKYLEQSSTSHDKQSENESKLKNEIESLRRKETETEADKKIALEKIRTLEENLRKSEETNKELEKRIKDVNGEMESLRKSLEGNDEAKTKEVNTLTEKLSRASEAITKMKERLREVITENENLKSVIKAQKEEIETGSQEAKDSKERNVEFEKTVESLKKQISVEEAKTETKIESLIKTVTKLEEENKILTEKLLMISDNNSKKVDNREEIKNSLETALLVLKDEFADTKEYSASVILSTIERVFNDAVKGSLKHEKKPETTETKQTPVVPAPRTSLQIGKENTESQPVESLPKEKEPTPPPAVIESKEESPVKDNEEKIESGEQKSDNDNRFKSYDQGWRPTKPPPPPLFDDEDDDDEWFN